MAKRKPAPTLKPPAPEPLVPPGWTASGYIDRIGQLIRECEPYRPDLARLWRERIAEIQAHEKPRPRAPGRE